MSMLNYIIPQLPVYGKNGCMTVLYVKLREVSLSYVFPSQTLKKLNIGLSRASVAINASNPWLIYSACPNVMCLKLVWDILKVVMPLQPVR